MTNIVLYGGMRKDPKVGGGVGGTYEVAKNQTQHSPRVEFWVVTTNNPMPYAIIISNILEHFGVSMAGESKITLNAPNNKIIVDVIHKMGFFRDLTDRFYKHRSDKLATPVDPTTNPNHLHLIKYLQTRLLWTSFLQFQIELQSLSSKINMMDLDEENSEPES
ncbi:hypothetical protein Lal_00017037 [Lupinus albus]|nr:hypothetical protein Lal_00017037 [Lupinus albus]